MGVIKTWFTRIAEFIAASLLAAIFVTFILQIFFRYIPWLAPIGWSVNLISLLWVWLIFFGCACVVREKDHVTFDILVQAAPRGLRVVMVFMTATIVIGVMIWSFPATWDAIFGNRLMDLKKIQTLRIPITGAKIPIKWLFASYVLLMIVVILRYGFGVLHVLRYGPPETELEKLAPQHQSNQGDVS